MSWRARGKIPQCAHSPQRKAKSFGALTRSSKVLVTPAFRRPEWRERCPRCCVFIVPSWQNVLRGASNQKVPTKQRLLEKTLQYQFKKARRATHQSCLTSAARRRRRTPDGQTPPRRRRAQFLTTLPTPSQGARARRWGREVPADQRSPTALAALAAIRPPRRPPRRRGRAGRALMLGSRWCCRSPATRIKNGLPILIVAATAGAEF